MTSGHASPSPEDGFFGVFTVCTGNVCRSPAVERLLQDRLDGATPWGIALGSAGTAALVGQPVHPLTTRALRAVGVDPVGHVARSVTAAHLAQAAVILAATRAHRIPLVGLHPAARSRIFTVLEFTRLAEVAAAEAGDPWELVAVAHGLRGDVPAEHPTDDDLPDPIRGAYSDHEDAVSLVDGAAARLTAVLAGLGRQEPAALEVGALEVGAVEVGALSRAGALSGPRYGRHGRRPDADHVAAGESSSPPPWS